MAVVCPSCGVENRDKARFCLGCAASLDPSVGATPSPGDAVSRPRTGRRSSASRAARAARAARRTRLKRWVGAGAFALVVAAAGAWYLGHPAKPVAPVSPPLSVPALAAPVPQPAGGGEPGAEPAVSESAEAPPSPEAVTAAERLRASVADLERRDRTHRQELELERSRIAREVQRGQEPKRHTEAPAGSRPVPAGSEQPEQAGVPAPSAQVTVAEPAPTVDQVCAGSGNFLARDFCRMRECGKAAFAGDAVCVRFRQMDEARRD